MRCTNEKLGIRLSDYFTGHLSEKERSEMIAHLGDCPCCQTSLKTMQAIAGQQINATAPANRPHLTTEQVSKYYQSPSSLSRSEITEIEAHLRTCDECSYDLDFLRDMEDELRISVRSELARPTVFGTIAALFRKPALAYFLLLLTLYPTVRWIADGSGRSESVASNWSSSPAYEIAETRRSVGEMNVVRRPIDDPLLRLDLPFYHQLAEKQYRYSLVSQASGEAAELDKLVDYDSTGVIRMLLNTKRLPDGEYSLSLIEIDQLDTLDQMHQYFIFQLKTEP